MTDPAAPASESRPPLAWTEDEIFEVMSNPARRRIIKSLASGQGRTATDLRGATGKRLDATIKDCAVLMKGGFLNMRPDPTDGRRALYTLAPTVPITRTATGWELDFGCCLLRIS